MPFEGYDASDEQDPYCYDGTTVLKNKAGIMDAQTLEAFEAEMTTIRSTEPLPDGELDVAHYRAIHRHLFQDVYEWAGETRIIETSKGGNLFCIAKFIDPQLDKLFARLAGGPDAWATSLEKFVAFTAEFLADLNHIHPFREGNGRAQLSLIHLIGHAAGFPFDLTKVKRETFIPAMIASYHVELGPLTAELNAMVLTEQE